MSYSQKFKSRMVSSMMSPNSKSATALSQECGVPQSTLSRWLRRAKDECMSRDKKPAQSASSGVGVRPQRRSPEEKVQLVLSASGLGEVELGAFLRREGLHEAELKELQEEVRKAAEEGLRAKRGNRGLSAAEKELKKVRKELIRKEKALAETAALLVLRGKAEAFFSEGEEGDTNKRSGR